MKIALVLDDTLDRPDGVQQYVLIVGRWLAGRGHTVHYLVADTQRTDVPGVVSLGRFVSANFNGNRVRTPLPAGRARIRGLLARLAPDVVHVQLPCSPLLGGQVVRAASEHSAVVGTFHILPAAKWHAVANRALALAMRPVRRRLDAVMAVSQPAAEFARRAYGLRCEVAPNPIEVARFAGAKAHRDENLVTVKFLGRLVERKGVLQLIRAWQALPAETLSRARLVIGGRGPLGRAAHELAGTEAGISFTGFVDEADKPEFLAGADVAVFPSTGGESFGISLLEAMAAGAGAVLGGNNPGYASLLGGQPQSLVTPADTAAFARQLEHFIRDATARQQLGREQHALAKRFDIHVVGPQIEDVYRQALRRRP